MTPFFKLSYILMHAAPSTSRHATFRHINPSPSPASQSALSPRAARSCLPTCFLPFLLYSLEELKTLPYTFDKLSFQDSPPVTPLPPSPSSPPASSKYRQKPAFCHSSNSLMATIPDDDEAIVASPADTDVVISANARGDNLSFLEDWRPFLQPYHLIIVQAGAAESPSRPAFPVSVPQGFDYEVVTMANIISDLGSRASCIPSQASACRCAGWLFSQKRYIITLNNDCFPAKHPRKGEKVNALQQHAVNLSSPATPFFFNTLYDPFRSSCDFVRGYPFSLREGTPTVISHGLWLNVPDYDAATQLVRPSQRNLRYVDAVMTVPRGCLFPMSSLNLAFDRELIGAAMYFPPMGDSKTMGIHDDMWAGWCCKVICDHLGYGAKTGLPYVRREDTTSPFLKLKKEFTGMFRQEEIIPFFQSLRLSNAADTAEKCYLEIAQKVKAELSTLDPSFKKLATNMEVWIDLWNASNAVTPRGSSMSATSSNIAA